MSKEILDLFSALILDEKSNLKSEPYLVVEENFESDIRDRINSADISVRKDNVKGWNSRGYWPATILLEVCGREELIRKMKYITDFRNRSRFDPPRTLEELRDPAYAYFAGLAAGDGGFNGPGTWSIVDGGKPRQLDDSREFINKIARLIAKLFGITERSMVIRRRGNRIELKLSNKWFCRFIRHFFDLPKSYKKGELQKPSIFEREETTCIFWRGIFDTDGHIPEDSYRVSMSSATDKFLEKCSEDLQKQGIKISDMRKSARQLRISPESFSQFASKIGFSHPRKKQLLLEKLKRGSRNYLFCGRVESNILKEGYFDITEMEEVRVKGVGCLIKGFREEEDLLQKDLASEMGATKDQIYYWENDIYTVPLDRMKRLFDSEQELLEVLLEEEVKFKVGIRGKEETFVDLPLEVRTDIDRLASECIATGRELRIKNKNVELANEVEKIFGIDIEKRDRKFLTRNSTVVEFFKTFYKYKPKFKKHSAEEIKNLKDRLEIQNLI